ncbi:dTDP-4-dehydrorhamnose reductase [Parabacteroides sp.]
MRIWVVGANGFTGRRVLSCLSGTGKYEVMGCSLRPDILPGSGDYRFVQMDINNFPVVKDLFRTFTPDVVINTSALSVPDYCETHHEEAYATNVSAVEHLAECCMRTGSRLLHFSTDFVFDGGARELYTEEDLPAPVNYYGQTKYLGEQAVASICDNYAIIRVVVVYGKALPGQHGNILQLVKTRLENRQEIRVVSDQWRTPTWVGDIARGVELLLPATRHGIYHICGDECLSISEIAYRVADYFHLAPSLIRPVATEEMNEATPRPRFSGLSIEKARRDLGYSPSSLEKGLEELR